MPEESFTTITEKLAVPIYEDALSPFAKEVSKGLVSIASMVNSGVFLVEDSVIALTNVLRMTAENLAILPPDRISFERPRIALQALNEAKYLINEHEIQSLFSNLITSSLDIDNSNTAHPAYIEVIKQLQSDEALVLKYMFDKEKHRKGHGPTIDVICSNTDSHGNGMTSTTSEINLICEDAGCKSPSNSVLYFSNLKRTGLLDHSSSGTSFPPEEHERIFLSEKTKLITERNPHLDKSSFKSGQYNFTGFGHGFVESCISNSSI